MGAPLPIEFVLVTNRPPLARAAEAAGIERVLVDLERLGKAKRQNGRALFLSDHRCGDIAGLRGALRHTRVMARIDPWGAHSRSQIDRVLSAGAQGVMLPLAASVRQVEAFVAAVASRALVSILIETREGVEACAEIAAVSGVDEFHFGLNDLAISYRNRTIFDVFAGQCLDEWTARLRRRAIPFGVGGVTDPNQAGLPVSSDVLLGEQARFGSSIFWLGRTFSHAFVTPEGMTAAIRRIRSRLHWWRAADPHHLEHNRLSLTRQLRGGIDPAFVRAPVSNRIARRRREYLLS